MSETSYRCGAFTIDIGNRQFACDGRAVAMEPKVFDVIAELLRQPGRLLTRNDLLDAVWGHRFVTPSTLSRTIALARRAFGDDAASPSYIQTVHGAGYRFLASCLPIAPAAAPAPVADFGPPFALRLPERLEPLVGRGAQLSALSELIAEHRCVTVLGPGGIGKTQCALEAARQSAAAFPDGAWFFDLSATERAADWLAQLASALGIPAGEPEAVLQAISEVLEERRALLVVDNCEQFADELAASVLRILRTTRHVAILATSRRALDFAGEQRFHLPPLRLPEPAEDGMIAAEQIGRTEAVELLVRRVGAVRSDFRLDAANATDIAAICRALDGIPLALELAAARFALLSADQVLARLVERFRFLESDAAGRPQRHRSLRALLDWSFSLLSPDEQRLLAWSAVFAQSWSIDALIALAAPLGLDAMTAIDLLTGLVAHSLVSVVPGATPPRYRLLETVREYALAQLREAGEEDAARLAQLEAMSQVYRRANDEIHQGRMREQVQQLISDWANIDAAVETAASQPAGRQAGRRLIGSLMLLLKARGSYSIAQPWCRRVLEQPVESGATGQARAMLALGVLQVHTFTEASAVPNALPDVIRLAALEGDRWTLAYAHGYNAMRLVNEGLELPAALADAECAAELAGELGDDLILGLACLARSWVQFARDDAGAALEALSRAPESSGDEHQLHFIEMYRALAHYRLDHRTDAARHWLAAFEFVTGLSNIRGVAGSIEGCGYLAGVAGELDASARLMAAAAAIRERSGVPLFRLWSRAHAQAQRRLEAGLDAAALAACRDAGRQARPEDIVAETIARLREWARCPA